MKRALPLAAALLLPGLAPAAPPPAPTPAATPAPAKDAPLRNTLRWKTASELENVGFDVYRSNDEKGPFVRLTKTPLAGAGTTDEQKEYVFHDEAIEYEKTYWYYVESISLKGEREKFTPTFMAPVKRRPAATPAPAPAATSTPSAPAAPQPR